MFRRREPRSVVVIAFVATLGGAASAASPQAPHGVPMGTSEPAANMEKNTMAERRYPQPVLVRDLTDRLVLDPSGRQRALGRIDGVQRAADGELEIVVRYGGILGFGSRKIAVPAHTTTLLGQYLQIVDLDRAQLETLPTWSGAGATAVPAEEQVRIGINRN